MRRTLVLPVAIVATLVLGACAPGTLDAEPSASAGAPSASPSTAPDPSPSASPEADGERFDDVDLAASLVPLPFEPGEPDRWGDWTTSPRDDLMPGLDPAAFVDAPECAAAAEAIVALAPEEVVVGGYPYDDTLVSWVVVARMPSPDGAAAFVDAVDAAAIACTDVTGTAVEQYGVVGLVGPLEPSPAIEAAGHGFVAVAQDGSNHYTGYVVAAHDELVLMTVSDMMAIGWDERAVAEVQTEIEALDAAAGG
ncbi:hypothetical protein GCM10009846_01820 [Agrococcus versicolor]|uniref:Sensor domain-containing protein n=1 Tax=Agrococcus versicolor TaxID=501482 RepID=A0ABP5M9I0_9MICO